LNETLARHVKNQDAKFDLQAQLAKWQFGDATKRINANIKNLFVKEKFLTPQMQRKAFHDGRIVKLGMLQKQGGQIKTWRSRFFVLRSKALFYFKNEEAFANGESPRGVMLLKDMIPSNKDFICQPTRLFTIIGRPHAFTLHSKDRVLVMCTKTKDEKMQWMKTLQKAYVSFWKSCKLDAPVKSPGPDERTYGQLVDIAQDLEVIDMLEMSEIEEMKRVLVLRKCMELWKYYHKTEKSGKAS